jgi:hypothetical protein
MRAMSTRLCEQWRESSTNINRAGPVFAVALEMDSHTNNRKSPSPLIVDKSFPTP